MSPLAFLEYWFWHDNSCVIFFFLFYSDCVSVSGHNIPGDIFLFIFGILMLSKILENLKVNWPYFGRLQWRNTEPKFYVFSMLFRKFMESNNVFRFLSSNKQDFFL